jgi:hypothetical protein
MFLRRLLRRHVFLTEVSNKSLKKSILLPVRLARGIMFIFQQRCVLQRAIADKTGL